MTATGYHCLVQLKEPASGVSPRAAASTMGTRSGVMPISGFPARASLAISSRAVPEEATATRDARSTRGDRVTPTARALEARPRAKTPRRWASAEVAGDVIANDDMATGARDRRPVSHRWTRGCDGTPSGVPEANAREVCAVRAPGASPCARRVHGRRMAGGDVPAHRRTSPNLRGKCRTVIGRRGCNLEKHGKQYAKNMWAPAGAQFSDFRPESLVVVATVFRRRGPVVGVRSPRSQMRRARGVGAREEFVSEVLRERRPREVRARFRACGVHLDPVPPSLPSRPRVRPHPPGGRLHALRFSER